MFLFEREKKLIGLLGAVGIPVAPTDFQKLLFLYFTDTHSESKFRTVSSCYEFVPYKYGAFSFTSYHDRKRLEERNILINKNDYWNLTSLGKRVARELLSDSVKYFANQYKNVRGDKLIAETYRINPYLATRSKIIDRVLKSYSTTKLRIREALPSASGEYLFTIGYQQRTLECYVNIMLKNCIALLCDVRRNPVSRRYGFSKRTLKNVCSSMDIEYLHFPQLGIDSQQRKNHQDVESNHVAFAQYRTETLKNEEETLSLIRRSMYSGLRLALTCFERNPEECHRSVLADCLLEHPCDDQNLGLCNSSITASPSVSLKHL